MTNLYSYKIGSRGAKAIAGALGIKQIKHKGSRFRGHENKTVINWGSSNLPEEVMKCQVLNRPEVVEACSNKKRFFECMDEAGQSHLLVPYTTDIEQARKWTREGATVVCRTKLTGHSGEGIVLASEAPEVIQAPLYTKYVPKKQEYRIHCTNDDGDAYVFDAQRKARKNDVADEDVDWKIRNHKNGFVFARNELIDIPDVVEDTALKVFETTTLDFGAVDIIYNERENKAYVLEINTACGLEGTTLDNYRDMFKELLAA